MASRRQNRKMGTTQNEEPQSRKIQVVPLPSKNGQPPTILPPADRVPGLKQPLLLVAQVIWAMLILLPSMLWSLLRKIFPPSGKSFKDKVVLVTGAGRGLGRGLALEFAKEGAKVAVVDVFPTIAMETAREIEEAGGIAQAYAANVAVVEDIKRLRGLVTEELGPVDVLVNNAGLIHSNPLLDMEDHELKALVEVNLLSHFWMTREFLPSMRDRNSGHIVAISSASALAGLANATAYSACKSGIVGFMDSLRQELNLNPDNKINTTVVLPYFINTSAQYMDHFDLRLPAVSIEDVVNATISGIKRCEVVFTVPGDLYYALNTAGMLPQNVKDKLREAVYTRLILPTKETRENSPTEHIIDKLSAK